MGIVLKIVGALLIVAASAFIGVYICAAGAAMGGMEQGGWGFQVIPALIFGCLTGFAVSIVSLAITFYHRPSDFATNYVIAFASSVIACLTVGIGIGMYAQSVAAKVAAENNRHWQLVDQIKANPEVIFQEKWYEGRSDKESALAEVLGNMSDSLEREDLVRLMSVTDRYDLKILYSKKLEPNFLEEKYNEYAARTDEISEFCMIAIIRNPNTPLHILKEAADLPDQDSMLVSEANRKLKNRAQNEASL